MDKHFICSSLVADCKTMHAVTAKLVHLLRAASEWWSSCPVAVRVCATTSRRSTMSSARTLTQVHAAEADATPRSLVLKEAEPAPKKGIRWDETAVDNEFMNKRKSKSESCARLEVDSLAQTTVGAHGLRGVPFDLMQSAASSTSGARSARATATTATATAAAVGTTMLARTRARTWRAGLWAARRRQARARLVMMTAVLRHPRRQKHGARARATRNLPRRSVPPAHTASTLLGWRHGQQRGQRPLHRRRVVPLQPQRHLPRKQLQCRLQMLLLAAARIATATLAAAVVIRSTCMPAQS